MTSAPAYLDHNATTPAKPAVIAAVTAALGCVGNPSSVHRFGRCARRTVEVAREQVAALVGAAPSQVVFTASATEANNLALHGLGSAASRRILVSGIEHDSIIAAADEATRIAATADGLIDLAALERDLARDERPALVALMLANNETGAIQPVAEAARIARAHGALLLCDAAQAVGKIAVDIGALGCDALTVSAHKFGGPQGAAALVLAGDPPLASLIRGGGQERGRRAGTENVPAIAGFGVAAKLAAEDLPRMAALAAQRDRLEAAVRRVAPGAEIFAAAAERLPNTSCLSMPGVASETQIMALDLAGVAVSAGSACSSGKVRASRVLTAMGVPLAVANTAIRVSLGWTTGAADIDRFIESWTALWTRLGNSRAAVPAA
ncbi:MAG: cysteine desulfurase [Alphaproteobacteria bacterium]|nr:cysteine desulfurase [Alphaproteobacteria bacterium]